MSEDTSGTLVLGGVIKSPKKLSELLELLEEYDAQSPLGNLDMPQMGGTLPNTFTFEQILNGVLPSDLEEHIEDMELAYTWTQDGTSLDGASCRVETEEYSETISLSREGMPYLNWCDRDDATKRAEIEAFLKAEKSVERQGLVYAPSAHSRLADESDKNSQ